MNASGIIPLDVKVLVRPDKVEEKTAGGVYLADTTRDKEKYASVKATVTAVGASAFDDWSGGEIKPKAGERVVIAQYAGVNIKGDDGLEYRLCNDEDIIARLEAVQ
jgi:chaperonin GroES